jgi:hypothetical protein
LISDIATSINIFSKKHGLKSQAGSFYQGITIDLRKDERDNIKMSSRASLHWSVVVPWELPGCCLVVPWELPGCCLVVPWELPGCCLVAAWELPGSYVVV